MSQSSAQQPRVDWTYEEIVLVCNAVVSNGWRAINNAADERVVELSRLLRQGSPVHAAASPKFRNPNGVKRKSNDIATAHPEYNGGQTKGGKTTADVVDAFISHPERMHELANAFRAAITDPEPLPSLPDVDEDATFEEGRTFERRHLARERNADSRRRRIQQARHDLGCVRCEACGFDFEAAYGHRGRDFIECHHRDPLSVTGPRKTALRDLALLCSNCHRMIHRYRPWLTVEELGALVSNGALRTRG
ncbi:hypothetical protein GCM10010464_36060 [Pseudonocardia yunnanensis]|uniref:HNH endonuclease n=1 Tax=Pseudonocardia yunnanensis TaxID=58107 RepID=A0ABW4EPZ7_9PSEU